MASAARGASGRSIGDQIVRRAGAWAVRGKRGGVCVCDVPSVAMSGEASATSVDMEGTYVPGERVAQKVLVHALHMPVDTRT